MKKPLQTRIVTAMNRAGISDMHGALYNTHGPEVVRFVLRKARADFKRGPLAKEARYLAEMVSYFLEQHRVGEVPSNRDYQELAKCRRRLMRLLRK